MSASSAELKRLLVLLATAATKAEQDAYAAGWRDCHAAMVKAMFAITDAPALPDEEAAPIEHASLDHGLGEHGSGEHFEGETASGNDAYTNGTAHESSFAN